MKQSPNLQRLESILRSSTLVPGGFMGNDPRPVTDVIEDDGAALAELGYSAEEVADRMEEITRIAARGLGTNVTIEDDLVARVDDSRGSLVCPWPGEGRFLKRLTTAEREGTPLAARWSDLSIHMIRSHGFFEGRGSAFRIEPRILVSVIFTPTHPHIMDRYMCTACGYVYDPSKGDPINRSSPARRLKNCPTIGAARCAAPIGQCSRRRRTDDGIFPSRRARRARPVSRCASASRFFLLTWRGNATEEVSIQSNPPDIPELRAINGIWVFVWHIFCPLTLH